MSNTQDGYDELTADVRGEERSSDGSGLSAMIAVGITLLLGCGLVFAAYKLGQKTGVEDPPTLVAEKGPIREVPRDPGGRAIPNTENDSYRMVDGAAPPRTGVAVRDGIIVTEALPARTLQGANSVEASEARSEIVDIAEIAPAVAIDGEPDLTPGEIPDRSAERLVAGGADILAPRDTEIAAVASAVTPEVPRALNAGGGQLSTEVPLASGATGTGGGEAGELQLAADTVVAALPEPAVNNGAASARYPLPPRKPPLAQRPAAPASARARDPQPAAPQPGIAQPVPLPVAPVPAPRTAQLPTGAQVDGTIPPQPRGDAQVQLGALPTPDMVRNRWGQLKTAHSDLLGRLGLQVLPVTTSDGGQLFRLRVGPLPDGQTASRLCDQLRYRGVDCFVPRR